MNKMNKKSGVVSFEMLFGTMFLVFVVLLCLGMFVYTYPRQALEKEVHILAQQVKVTGGITTTQLDEFMKTMNEMGYTAEVNVYTKNNGSAMNVAPKNTSYGVCTGGSYNPFVRRDSGQKIVIDVAIGANDGLVRGPLAWFGAQTLPDNYIITETVLSERNRC